MAGVVPSKLKALRKLLLTRKAFIVYAGIFSYFFHRIFIFKEPAPIVNLTTGRIQGIVSVSRSGREFYEYLSIPYAQPPVGALRFASPQPPTEWKGVRDGSQEAPSCLQINVLTTLRTGREDCLYLNVYTPKGVKGPLPVMVYIFGGAFIGGDLEHYGSHYLMEEDIVLVTLNFRVGILGFLNAGTLDARGNQGLKDQTMALKWIQENISKFRGDPKKVLLFGESAGAATIHFHILSPMSKGLFHKGISQSGNALSNYMFNKSPEKQNQYLANRTNCPLSPKEDYVKCLKGMDPHELVDHNRVYLALPRDLKIAFMPTVEKILDADAFLVDEPETLLKSGRFNRIPWMSGVTSDEGLMTLTELARFHPHRMEEVIDDWTSFSKYLDVPNNKTLMEELRAFYFPDDYEYKSLEESNVRPYSDMFSDRIYYVSNHIAARLQAQFSPVYLYYYPYMGGFSMVDVMSALQMGHFRLASLALIVAKDYVWRLFGWNPRFPGVSHCEMLVLLFAMLPTPRVDYPSTTEPDYLMSSELIRTWAQFARDETKLKFFDVPWHPLNPHDDAPMYMNLNFTNPKMIPEPFHERVRFWNSKGIY